MKRNDFGELVRVDCILGVNVLLYERGISIMDTCTVWYGREPTQEDAGDLVRLYKRAHQIGKNEMRNEIKHLVQTLFCKIKFP